MPIPSSLATLLLLSATVATTAVLVVASFRSTIELLPFARPNAPSHDVVLKGGNFVANLLLLYLAAVLTGNLPKDVGIAIAALTFLSLVQAFGGEAGYNLLKNVWKDSQQRANDATLKASLDAWGGVASSVTGELPTALDSVNAAPLPTVSAEPPAQ
jgi:hypothetical protein